jgi:signal transduction histidine kinase
MDFIARERDRILQRTARVSSLSLLTVSILCLIIPGAVQATTLLLCLPLYLIMAIMQFQVGRSRSVGWIIPAFVAGIISIALISGAPGGPSRTGFFAAAILGTASLASLSIVLTTTLYRRIMLLVSFVAVSGVTILGLQEIWGPIRTAAAMTLGWLLATLIGLWISSGVSRTMRRIAGIGHAHLAERHASEAEAQRRQGARLLHDTVLATLTLLAHSGVGVSADALRAQAGGDARLLRQLRLGAAPAPLTSGDAHLGVPVSENVLGTTLESVKQRFGSRGLEVKWYGTGQVLLPSDVLDAFLLALSECLENVRRHSGVTDAHVTITQDDTTVRAMITDAGVGFVLDDVDSASLGFKESVVARLKDVGGQARLFSTPGSGTTVILEVPR